MSTCAVPAPPAGGVALIRVEVWGFIWLMIVLKIPIVALLYLVWWAVHQVPEPVSESEDGEGGLGQPHPHRPVKGPDRPRRRGPHGDPAPPAPARTRAGARARDRSSR